MTEDGGLGTHLRLYQLGQTVVNAYPALGVALEGCLDPPPPQGPSPGVLLVGIGAITRTPQDVDRCFLFTRQTMH